MARLEKQHIRLCVCVCVTQVEKKNRRGRKTNCVDDVIIKRDLCVLHFSLFLKEKKMEKKREEEEDETEGVDLFNRLAAKASGRLPLRFFFSLFCPVRYDAISLLCVIF